jgi:hypothetical protein
MEDYAVQQGPGTRVIVVTLNGKPVFHVDVFTGIYGDLPRFPQRIGKSPAGYDGILPLVGFQAEGGVVGLIIVNHKQEIAIGVVADHFTAVPVGYVKKALPHGKSHPAQAPIPLQSVKGKLIFQAANLQGKQIFPDNGTEAAPGTGSQGQTKQNDKNNRFHEKTLSLPPVLVNFPDSVPDSVP